MQAQSHNNRIVQYLAILSSHTIWENCVVDAANYNCYTVHLEVKLQEFPTCNISVSPAEIE